jgi:tetratricopeptide (TPR) repeat protein
MSIFDRTGERPTITKGERALDLFTDRRKTIRRFCEYLNVDPPPEKVLFLHGDGGNGKSLLLRYLRTHCSKRFSQENWHWIATVKDEDEFLAHLTQAEQYEPIPNAYLDFGAAPTSEWGDPQQPMDGLLMLQTMLAPHKLRFPLFTFAIVLYLHKTHRLDHNRIKKLFPSEELDFVAGLEALLHNSAYIRLAKAVLGLMDKHIGQGLTVWRHERNLDEGTVQRLQRMEPNAELMLELPSFFAADLNTALLVKDAPSRITLLFDTHEAFWGVKERDLADERFFFKDRWFRMLLGELNLAEGIVAVVAGREPPRWPRAADKPIPVEYIELIPVGHFGLVDADYYLQRAGVSNDALRAAVNEFCRVEDEEYHPLLLGLAADIVLASELYGKSIHPKCFKSLPQIGEKTRYLIGLLLRYVDKEMEHAVRAMAACRAFDRNLYLMLGSRLKFHATESAFCHLTSYSFVRPVEGAEGQRYRIHNLLRRLWDESDDQTLRAAHAELIQHYYECVMGGDEEAIAEVVYHVNRLEPERGVHEWTAAFEQALQRSRHTVCAHLLSVLPELEVGTEFDNGMIAFITGRYFAAIERHEEAEIEYHAAINAFDEAPDDVNARSNQGLAQQKLGVLLTGLSRYAEAERSFKEAITICDKVLRLAPDYVDAYNNRGSALLGLGELQVRLSRHAEAERSYQDAIAAYGEVLRLAPDFVPAHNNLGLALTNLGELQMRLSSHEAAMQSYRDAIVVYGKALRLAPTAIPVHNNRGRALQELGTLLAGLSHHEAAMQTYQDAVAAYDEALFLAPRDPSIHANRGFTLQSLGELQVRLSRHAEAERSYQDAISVCNKALQLGPANVAANIGLANALCRLGKLLVSLFRYEEAEKCYRDALAAYDKALHLAPDNVDTHNNRGFTLQSLGELQVRLSRHAEAKRSYQDAIAAYGEALSHAPDFVQARNNRSLALQSLGEL